VHDLDHLSERPARQTVRMDPWALTGRWRLDRRIADRRSGQFGRVRGELSIEADGGGLRWVEVGELGWDGRMLSVSRTLLMRQLKDGWWMTFADGRPFHLWTTGQQIDHRCAADTYLGMIDAQPDRIRTLWDVTGPSKSLRIVTRFTPCR
jgi:hypothetical protein